LNCNPQDLGLPSCYDYKHESPVLGFCKLLLAQKVNHCGSTNDMVLCIFGCLLDCKFLEVRNSISRAFVY
jgi:hypothetical protein